MGMQAANLQNLPENYVMKVRTRNTCSVFVISDDADYESCQVLYVLAFTYVADKC